MSIFRSTVDIPEYLQANYWWAYLHPRGVRFFENRWIVNLILFGNYHRLCDAVTGQLGSDVTGRTLQIACVYGNLTERLARVHRHGQLDVVDVAPIQLANLRRKLQSGHRVRMFLDDSTRLSCADNSYRQSLLFFLLHEQPEPQRIQTLREALRVTAPGGRLIIVDYHRPSRWSPLRYLMTPVLRTLEPFALDLWRYPLSKWLPEHIPASNIGRQTYFGGLYQKLVITLPE